MRFKVKFAIFWKLMQQLLTNYFSHKMYSADLCRNRKLIYLMLYLTLNSSIYGSILYPL